MATKVLLLLCFVGLSFALLPPRPKHFTAIPNYAILDGKTLQDPIEWEWTAPAELGGNTTLKYNIVHNDKIIFLDDNEEVEGLMCENQTMYIEVMNYEVAQNWTVGSILVGGKNWNCTNQKGDIRPFYRRIVNITEWSYIPTVYEIYTEYLSVYDCFNKSSVFLYSTQLVSSDKWSYLLNNDPNGKAGLVARMDPHETVWTESFSYNYDNNTGNAAGPIVIFDEDGVSFTCTNCYTVLQLSLAIEFDVYWDFLTPHVSNFEVVAEGNWKTNVDLELLAQGSWSDSGSIQVADITLPTIEFCIGYIPVWIDIDIPVNLDYSASISAELEVTAGFDVEAEATYGIQYQESSGWAPIQNEQLTDHVHNPTFTTQIDAQASATLVPQVDIEFYGIGGPYLTIQPGLDAQFTENNGKYCIDIGDALQVDIGAELTWPINEQDSYELYNYAGTLYDVCQ